MKAQLSGLHLNATNPVLGHTARNTDRTRQSRQKTQTIEIQTEIYRWKQADKGIDRDKDFDWECIWCMRDGVYLRAAYTAAGAYNP